jgi:hypothetical protein
MGCGRKLASNAVGRGKNDCLSSTVIVKILCNLVAVSRKATALDIKSVRTCLA